MKERPILFSAPMVRAILNGSKSQTRRVVKPARDPNIGCWMTPGEIALDSSTVQEHISPYGQPGDRLWVREAWKAHTTFDHLPPRDIPESHVWYMADDGYKAESRYRQGMFMPRWASRITLEVTGVRVERLQDISEADAIDEGIWKTISGLYSYGDGYNPSYELARDAYRGLWESINGTGSWYANPWVWVVEFKRINGGEK